MKMIINEAEATLGITVLPKHPFPEAVTSRNQEMHSRLGEWTEGLETKIRRDLDRLACADKPKDWEEAALRHALYEWRVYETFRRLHEEGWCPGLLFQLKTKTGLLTLCDSAADSSPGGFDERKRKVLAKRGIDHRLKWRRARRMVKRMGLLEETSEEEATEKADLASPASAASAAPSPAESHEEVAGAEAEPSPALHDLLPPLLLDRVWSALPTYTKTQLEAVCERFGVGLWSQFGDRFYTSMRKPEMRSYTERVVRHHACLDAAYRLADRQLDALHDWMQANLTELYQRDDDLRIAARLFGDFQAMAALSADGHGLSPVAWDRYRDGELRRIAAFCYHRFREVAPTRSGEAA